MRVCEVFLFFSFSFFNVMQFRPYNRIVKMRNNEVNFKRLEILSRKLPSKYNRILNVEIKIIFVKKKTESLVVKRKTVPGNVDELKPFFKQCRYFVWDFMSKFLRNFKSNSFNLRKEAIRLVKRIVILESFFET